MEMEKARREERMERHGLLIVHTGDGKGKTTAAMGLAVRAWGDGLRVLILQFIKGSWQTGERHAIEVLARAEGRINSGRSASALRERARSRRRSTGDAAEAALKMAADELQSGRWDMVILDEVNYAVRFGLITEEELNAHCSNDARRTCISSARGARPARCCWSGPTSSRRCAACAIRSPRG